jgi:hypothetical protein
VSMMGLAAVWAFWSINASVSFAVGAGLGLGYALLLGKSVEAIGNPGPGAERSLCAHEETVVIW